MINILRLILSVVLLTLATTLMAQIPEDCADRQQANNWPEYYCDCKYNYQKFSIPLDIDISESMWFQANIKDLAQGISAYLHSDCEMKFEVYLFCTSGTPEYEAVFEQNKANTIDGSTIKRKLEEAGYGDSEALFNICISPVNGFGGRLIMRSEAEGIPSSCEDPLYIFPGMSLYSTQTTDVYIVDPSSVEEAIDIILHWEGDDNVPCELKITSNSCDGSIVDEVTLDATNNCYTLTAEVLDEAWSNDEIFFLHFSHESNTKGFVHCLIPEYTSVYTDTTICQGMGVELADTLLTETTVYLLDTVFLHTNQYRVNYLNLVVENPDIQKDTLAFKYTKQPYLYREQHTITAPGDYDLTIHTPGQCDERYLLHVYHDTDTLVSVVDTFLCYGAVYQFEGKKYQKDVSLGKTYWKNQDTLVMDSIYVSFAATPEIIIDTIMQNSHKYNTVFGQAGVFNFTYTNPTTYCVDSIILHVLPDTSDGVTYEYVNVLDTTLCQGKTYTHWDKQQYTSSTVIYDSIWYSDDYCEIDVTTLVFTETEMVYDTISIMSYQLPYWYREELITNFGDYEFLLYNEEGCLENVFLHVSRNVPSDMQQPVLYHRPRLVMRNGMIYVWDGKDYFTILGEKL